jgi:tetratricopeptide (TPR) repeat protein
VLTFALQALEIYQRLAQKNPDRYESYYAGSLNNYADHLSDAGKNEEALTNALQALEIYQRLAQKNPDRFEPNYAGSLNNYATYLSDAGKKEEALMYARQALEIRQRLVQKNPDRYEPDYAVSLNNYVNCLSDAGNNEEALTYGRQALEIYLRLAGKHPARYEADLFSSTCHTHFLSWLSDPAEKSGDLAELNAMPTTAPRHRLPLLQLYSKFVQACLAPDQTIRALAYKEVISTWGGLSLADKYKAQGYWLCAAAWCAVFAPEAIVGIDWQASWRQFTAQRHGCLPHWMQEFAQRFSFQWPTETKLTS